MKEKSKTKGKRKKRVKRLEEEKITYIELIKNQEN